MALGSIVRVGWQEYNSGKWEVGFCGKYRINYSWWIWASDGTGDS